MGSAGYFCLKLNMNKAYNRVQWDFFQSVMLHMGFSKSWVKKIINYIYSAYFWILINVMEEAQFTASRDIRQGRHFFPFLFIIFTKGFSALIDDTVFRGLVKGLQVGEKGLVSSSLFFFVDDNLLFTRANLLSGISLRSVIK